LEGSHELLTEAQRGGDRSVWEREERIKHWLRCVATARNRNGSFGMAAQIYKKSNTGSSVSPQCLHRLAIALIGSPHIGQFAYSSVATPTVTICSAPAATAAGGE
jgi:hypothetical protein